MSSTKFIALMPKTVEPGDKVRVRGKVVTDAEEFSINFANESCHYPGNISYHFKWVIPGLLIEENSKLDGEWLDHKQTKFPFNGPGFALEFALNSDAIYAYLIEDDDAEAGRILLTVYTLPDAFALTDIKSIQVWGDVEKVTELVFSYS